MSNNKITMKSTKAEMMEAIKAQEEKLMKMQESKFEPEMEKKKVEIKEIHEKAKEIIDLKILDQSIIDKYRALEKDIELKKQELKDLFDIEANVTSIAATVEAKKELIESISKQYDTKKLELEDEISELKEQLEFMIKENNMKKIELTKQLQEEYKEEKAKLEKTRIREEEEYKYNLERLRKKDNDAWSDSKAKKEKELAERMAIVEEKEESLKDIETLIAAKDAEIETLNNSMQTKIKEACDAGKAEEKRSNAIEINRIKKDAENTKNLLEKELEFVKASNLKLLEEKEELKAKLDEAYVKMTDLATSTVTSGNKISVIESSSKKDN